MPPPQRTAAPRSNGGGTVRSSSNPQGSNQPGQVNGAADPASQYRNRGDRPANGTAVPRQHSTGDVAGGFQYVRPYGWSPYSYYRAPYYGYGVDPFFYGYGYPYSRWAWSRYGMWYDPFSNYGYYSPMYLDPFGYGYGYGSYGIYSGLGGYGGYSSYDSYGSESLGGSYSPEAGPPRLETTGSIRIRVKPSDAQVYLDGKLAGVVDQFDGLKTHLIATTGHHELEIRAEGYEPLKISVTVTDDKTVTARGSLRSLTKK
jgi:hypothetical protein